MYALTSRQALITANRVLIITVGVRKPTQMTNYRSNLQQQVLVKETRLQQLILDDVISTGQSGAPRQCLQIRYPRIEIIF